MSGRSTPSMPRDWVTGWPKSGRSGGVRPLRLPLPGRGCHRGPSRRVGPAAGGDDGADRRRRRGVGRALRGATRRHRLLSAARDRRAAPAAPFNGETLVVAESVGAADYSLAPSKRLKGVAGPPASAADGGARRHRPGVNPLRPQRGRPCRRRGRTPAGTVGGAPDGPAGVPQTRPDARAEPAFGDAPVAAVG